MKGSCNDEKQEDGIEARQSLYIYSQNISHQMQDMSNSTLRLIRRLIPCGQHLHDFVAARA